MELVSGDLCQVSDICSDPGRSQDSLRAYNRPPNRPIPAPGAPVVKPDLGPPVIYRPATRPPLAGPYAFSRFPTPVWNKPRVFLQHDIPDTWLFANFSSGYAPSTALVFLHFSL